MRNAFSKALVDAARHDERVMLLTGDHGYALFDDFQKECPRQYLNAGVAEQNMVGVAAGLAKDGFRPVVYGLSAFVPIRVLEQIKLDVCYEGLPVVFVGDGAGVVYSALGSSHQSTEDVSALRALPGISILAPADSEEMTRCMKLAQRWTGPVYLRMGKADLGAVSRSTPTFDFGDLHSIQPGDGDLAFIANGALVKTALELSQFWPGTAVWSAPCLKPLNDEQVTSVCRQHLAVIVLEEHSVFGGLGSAVAEISCTFAPTWVCRIGIQDRFSTYCGSYDYLIMEHGLDAIAVKKRIEDFLLRLP